MFFRMFFRFFSLFLLISLLPLKLYAMPEELFWALDKKRPALALDILKSWRDLLGNSPEDIEDKALSLWMESRILAFYMGDYRGAERVIDSLIFNYPLSRIYGDAYFEKVFFALERGERQRALKRLSDFIKNFPNHPRIRSAGYFLALLKDDKDSYFKDLTSVRVALDFSGSSLLIEGEDLVLKNILNKTRLFQGKRLSLKLNQIKAYQASSQSSSLIKQPLLLDDNGKGFKLNGRSYKGELFIYELPNTFLLVNILDMESYLKGVLPAEMPPSWSFEALKAQAVAARTYALYHVLKRTYSLYDLKANTDSQVFSPEREDKRSSRAVDATRGEILIWAGEPALTVFHSDSGGRLEAAGNIWEEDFPYLGVFKDPFSYNTPNSFWTYSISERELRRLLPELGSASSQRLKISARNSSGRVLALSYRNFKGEEKSISATALRSLLGTIYLKSTDFSLYYKGGDIVFEGRGFGHGVGMSQWGARKMAESGRNYKEILSFYYPGLHWGSMAEDL